MGLVNRLIGFFRRSSLEQELDEEVQHHIELKARENIEAGMPPEEARYAALRAFGGVEQKKEECRDADRLRWIEDLVQDLRYGVRQLRRNPGFTVVAVLTLALGIGANTAVFSLLDGLVLRPLPVPHPEQLVRFGVHASDLDPSVLRLSLPMFREISRNQTVFSSTFVWYGDAVENVEANGTLSLDEVWAVGGNFYSELAATPEVGRLIGPEDVDVESDVPVQVAVLSYDFCQRSYGGAREALGKVIKIAGVPFIIIGVTRKGFKGVSPDVGPAVTVPLTAEPLISGATDVRSQLERGAALWLFGEGRLKPGVTMAEARSQLLSLWPTVRAAVRPVRQTPAERERFDALEFRVDSGAHGTSLARSRFKRPLSFLLAISGVVLLITCVNLASLMLARTASRRHEMALRAALGARRFRLARQMLTEGVTLSVAGALLGGVFALWSSHALAGLILSRVYVVVPASLNLSPDSRILGFTAAITTLTGILFGIAPAWRASRTDPSAALKQGTRTVGPGAGALGQTLIVTQVGLSLVLVATAGLFVRSLAKLRAARPGIGTHRLLQMRLASRPGGYTNLDLEIYYRELTEQVASLPGVKAAGISGWGIENGFEWTESVRNAGTAASGLSADLAMVMPGFFRTTGIALLQGRTFTWQDDSHGLRVAIASESLARRLFPGGNSIGQRIEITSKPEWPSVEIIGIVSDASLYDIRKQNPPTLYIASAQYGDSMMGWPWLLVRTAEQPPAAVRAVKACVLSLGHEYAISAMTQTVDESINDSLLRERLAAMLSGFYGTLALLLAAVGLYGLIAFEVTGRTREIGIRMALGAERGDVLRLVVGQGFKLILIGMGIGIIGALALTRFLTSLLYGVKPTDPLTFIAVSLILTAVALVASYIPARRATEVDPMVALRYE